MWMFFLGVALLATLGLLVFITVEVNTLDKDMSLLIAELKEHYESQ